MGIPTYFRVITQQYTGIIKTTSPKVCNHLFIDFNGLIHEAAYNVLDKTIDIKEIQGVDVGVDVDYRDYYKSIECSINEMTWKYLNNCISYVTPLNSTYTCIDGVAPVAKLSQQRKRRYLSVLQNKLMGTSQKWDRNAISPGTSFMINLESYMNKQFREKGTCCKINYFSGSNEPGEGEHKLFAILNTIDKNEVAIVYGLDADLIMLSLISHHPKIHLMREQKHVSISSNNQDTQTNAATNAATNAPTNAEDAKDLLKDTFIYVDIHLLRTSLLKELAYTYNWDISNDVFNDAYCEEANDIIESYVTACILLGNDFLPHIPSLSLKKNGHTRLLNAVKYAWDKTQNGPLVCSGKINVELLKELLKELSKDEDNIIFKMNEEYLKKKPFENRDANGVNIQDPVHCYAIQQKNKDPLAQYLYTSNYAAWRIYYYKHLFHCRLHDMITVNNACEQFIKGIYWVYYYYKRLPKDPKWVYPFNYSPTVLDLSNYIQGTIDEWCIYQSQEINTSNTAPASSAATAAISSITAKSNPYVTRSPYAAINKNIKNIKTKDGFVSSVVQLLSILPPESVELLPKSYQKYMLDPKYGCMHMFPRSYPVQTYLKTYLWECTPVLPALDVNLLEKIIENKS